MAKERSTAELMMDNLEKALTSVPNKEVPFEWNEFQEFFKLHDILMEFVVEPLCKQTGIKHEFVNVDGKNYIKFIKG